MTLVVGLGSTGLSCARHMHAQGDPFAVADSRCAPPGIDALRDEFPGVHVRLGPFDPEWFASFDRLLVSPGVSLREQALARAIEARREVLGDIELFARNCRAPVVAITGSNGKSTVTTLVQLMLESAGHRALAGGNLGPPALELLNRPAADFYVLELSSFQLETLSSLRPAVASVINLSPDHLDRYGSAADYAAAKARIYRGAGLCVYNADDRATMAGMRSRSRRLAFTLQRPRGGQFGLRERDDRRWLACGATPLLPVDEICLRGEHNLANALAALAIVRGLGIEPARCLEVLRRFTGLPHRMQLVRTIAGVQWINDSKGTNVGATVAALKGLGQPVVLIAGGEGKGADFSPLRAQAARTRAVILLGQSAPRLSEILAEAAQVEMARDMNHAVSLASGIARPGDAVLLSPACASFDMFDNYQQRGEAFVAAVEAMEAAA